MSRPRRPDRTDSEGHPEFAIVQPRPVPVPVPVIEAFSELLLPPGR